MPTDNRMNSMLEEYKSSLADLTFNSKPLINMLTVLAEENYGFAADIVRIIESQVYQSPPNQRLPVLYLIDSIVKSYTPYVKLFSPNLIKTFLFVFEKAETKVRQDLYKLRSTWSGMFSKVLLHDLDIAVKQFDPNWPIRKKKKKSAKHSCGLTLDERVAAMMSSQRSSEAQDSKFSSDEEEYNASYQSADDSSSSPQTGPDILVEEEEILVDEDEKFEDLEALERALQKKKEELSQLEAVSEEEDDKPGTSGQQYKARSLSPQPLSAKVQMPYFIDANEDTRMRALSATDETEEPQTKRLKMEQDDLPSVPGLRRISQEIVEDEPTVAKECESPSPDKDDNSPLQISEVKEAQVQTDTVDVRENQSQTMLERQDQSTQYRYRKKTKNFLSQYRVPSKSVATYFRIKTKEAQTQYSPPFDTQDVPADSTSGHLDGKGDFGPKERSALKDYVSALKDEFLPQGYAKHFGVVLRSLYAQRRQGLLCDITLGAEGRVFKAHKSVLAASSDFFYTLFASEEIEKTPLSHIELQGITAKALNLVLDYIYTSVLPIGGLSSVDEIIIAAKRLQILSLISTCPALEEAVAKKTDLSGWLISNSSLLSPSNKHPYVEAINSLRTLSSGNSVRSGDLKCKSNDMLSGAGDGGAGDFICHVDRDISKKRSSDTYGLPNSYEHLSNDEVKQKRKKHSKLKQEYEDKSDTESDIEADHPTKINESPMKDVKYDGGVVASPGMPPSSWMEGISPKSKKRKKKALESETYTYKCMNCERLIRSKQNYISHCEAHLRKGQKPYSCKLCKKAFWKDAVLESHMYKVHTELSNSQVKKLISAKVRNAETPSDASQRKMDPHATSPVISKTKDSLKKDNNRGKRECASCKMMLQNEVLLARHIRLHHPDMDLPSDYQYQCGYCLKYFKTGGARAVHVKMHVKAGDILQLVKKDPKRSDYDVGRENSDDDSLGEESIAYSSNQEEGPTNIDNVQDLQEGEAAIKLKLYQCEVCGEMFSIQCFYKAHMAGHKRNLEEY